MKRSGKTGVILLVLSILAGCNNSRLATETIETGESNPICENAGDSIRFTIKVEYPTAWRNGEVLESVRNVIISAVFGNEYLNLDINDAIAGYIADETEEYRETNLDLWEEMKEEGNEMPNVFSWEQYIEAYISDICKNTVSYVVTKYEYSGGAHGVTSEIAVNLDKKTGRVIEEEDFFVPGYREQLGKLLTKYLKPSLKDEGTYDMLFSAELTPNGNFRITNEGVTYIYGQYEIGPYSMGIIHVTVPWQELDEIISD